MQATTDTLTSLTRDNSEVEDPGRIIVLSLDTNNPEDGSALAPTPQTASCSVGVLGGKGRSPRRCLG